MPDTEPLPGAPESVWAGEQDAALYFNTIGYPWLAPFAAVLRPRIVHISELCSSTPPAVSPITLSDIVALQAGGETADAAQLKLHEYVDRGLWEGNCRYVDNTPVPPLTPQDPPPGLPTGPPPVGPEERRSKDMYRWLYWMATEYVPRTFETGDSTSVSGTGHWTIAPKTDGEWSRESVGVKIVIDAQPDYVGRSNGGDFPVFYDLGWYSLDSGSGAQSPIRLHHTEQITTASSPKVAGFFYNLAPGVEITVTALYPNLPSPPEGIG